MDPSERDALVEGGRDTLVNRRELGLEIQLVPKQARLHSEVEIPSCDGFRRAARAEDR